MKESQLSVMDFIRHGSFMDIPFGISRERLLDILGPTDWTACNIYEEDSIPSLYKYGRVEFYFPSSEENRLYGILVQPSVYPADEGKIKFRYEWLEPNPNLRDVRAQLTHLGIPFKQGTTKIGDEDILITNNEVLFMFYEQEKGDENELCKVGLFIDTPLAINYVEQIV